MTKTEIQFSGTSTLPNRACIETQLYENDEAVGWWPAICANLHGGLWEMRVFLDTPLRVVDPEATYTLKAWLRNMPTIAADPFVFDMAGPPTPAVNPETAVMTLLLDAATLLAWETTDLDGDGLPEIIVLAGFGGVPDHLGYDFRELTVAGQDNGPDAIAGYTIVWRSGSLANDRAEFLPVENINADDQPEIIVKQALGAA
ncbi:MAG: hypothetical protein JXR84_10770 [Anaerolineae bacterium]|nr:hypothetical protein [Anaerolineae bacterium]